MCVFKKSYLRCIKKTLINSYYKIQAHLLKRGIQQRNQLQLTQDPIDEKSFENFFV